ncbi:hypothetical protein [Candidatus Poriferisocius sp.]|uniref:hypothetical protein n=1 Tax=Candidatus Poriferisocius sp. TaxID=3101276 RepID=UPI003B02B212
MVAFATRKKRALWDIFPGPVPEENAETQGNVPDRLDSRAEPPPADDDLSDNRADSGTHGLELVEYPAEEAPPEADISWPNQEGLAAWHRLYELTVSAWIENHQKVLGTINASGLQIDLGSRDELMAGHEELAPKMREAIASHPSPVMRAELSAMHVAGEATVFAVIKSDYETARRQHLVYVQYRDEWIERLRQFSENPMGKLRSVLTTTEFELEEIRAALESALIETEEPDEDEPDFEAPIMVRENSTLVFDIDDQPDDVLEAAVGTPEDTTSELEDGRIPRLLKRLGTPTSFWIRKKPG